MKTIASIFVLIIFSLTLARLSQKCGYKQISDFWYCLGGFSILFILPTAILTLIWVGLP